MTTDGFLGGYPATASGDFYAGVFLGWTGHDVKASMNECFPQDDKLAELIGTTFDAWSQDDWETVLD
jgi:hypothetical protein